MRIMPLISVVLVLSASSAIAVQSGKGNPAPTPLDEKLYEALKTPVASCKWKTEPQVEGSTCDFKMVGSVLCTKRMTTGTRESLPPYYSCTIINMPDSNFCLGDVYDNLPIISKALGYPSRYVEAGKERFSVSGGGDPTVGGYQEPKFTAVYTDVDGGEHRYPADGSNSKCDLGKLCESIANAVEVKSSAIENNRISKKAIIHSSYCRDIFLDRMNEKDVSKLNNLKQKIGIPSNGEKPADSKKSVESGDT